MKTIKRISKKNLKKKTVRKSNKKEFAYIPVYIVPSASLSTNKGGDVRQMGDVRQGGDMTKDYEEGKRYSKSNIDISFYPSFSANFSKNKGDNKYAINTYGSHIVRVKSPEYTHLIDMFRQKYRKVDDLLAVLSDPNMQYEDDKTKNPKGVRAPKPLFERNIEIDDYGIRHYDKLLNQKIRTELATKGNIPPKTEEEKIRDQIHVLKYMKKILSPPNGEKDKQMIELDLQINELNRLLKKRGLNVVDKVIEIAAEQKNNYLNDISGSVIKIHNILLNIDKSSFFELKTKNLPENINEILSKLERKMILDNNNTEIYQELYDILLFIRGMMQGIETDEIIYSKEEIDSFLEKIKSQIEQIKSQIEQINTSASVNAAAATTKI